LRGRVSAGAAALVVVTALEITAEERPRREDARRTSADDFEVDPNITPLEMRSGAETSLKEMRDALREITSLLDEARAQKDIVLLNCVNEKLTQIKGLTRVADDSSVELDKALRGRNRARARHEYTKIQIARRKIRVLLAEAKLCAGDGVPYTGETRVEVEIDPSIADENPSYPEDPLISDPPRIASPTM
jgi:hypothetical protein